MDTLFCGMAILDIFTGKVSYFEFNTVLINHANMFDSIGSYHQMHHPNEVLLITDLPEQLLKKMKMHVFGEYRCNIIVDLNNNTHPFTEIAK